MSDSQQEKVCFEREDYSYVITQRDFAQLIHKCIIAPNEIKYAIFGGISNNKIKSMDLTLAKELIDYSPQDDFFDICERIESD